MFIGDCQLHNVVGSFYSSGKVLFHPRRNLLYTPLGSRIKQIDLEHNVTMVLQFECQHNIDHIVIDPNGNTLIAIDSQGFAIVYNLIGDFIIAHFNFKGKVEAACFSPDAKLFAVGIQNGFRVYQAPPFRRSFEPLLLIKKYKSRHTAKLTSLSFSPDSRFLISGGDDNKVFLNNILSIPDYVALTFDVHRYRIVECFFDQQMKYLYTCDRGGNVYSWKWVEDHISEQYKIMQVSKKRKLDIQRNRYSSVKEQALKEENDEADVAQLEHPELFSDFQKSTSRGRFILAKKLIISHPACYVKGIKYLPSMGLLSSCYSNGKFSVWKLEGEQLEQVHTFSIGEHKINSLSVNFGGNWIALAIKQLGQLIVWQWRSQSFIFNQTGLLYETSCIAYSPAATVIAAGGNDGKVKLWDQKSGFCFATFEQHDSLVTDVKFTNQTTLISSSYDGTVKAYDTGKYKCFRTLRPETKCQLSCLAVEPSGEIICAGSIDPYEVYCWNLQTGSMLQVLSGHKGPISCISFAGDRLVTGSWDRTIRIHDFYAKRSNADSLDQSSEITAMASSPDSKNIAVCTFKGQIYIWDVIKSEVVAIIDCKKDIQSGRKTQSSISADNDINSRIIKCLEYTSDGQYLIAAGKCKDVLLYDIKHRLLLKKYTLTGNRDIDGVVDWLNSKNIKQGMNLNELEVESASDADPSDNYLPGAKKLDVSRRSKRMEISVNRIIVSDKEFAVGTNFGIMIFGLSRRSCFSPYELLPKLTPSMIPELLNEKQYTSAVIVALKLNIPIRKLLSKLHSKYTQQICEELSQQYSKLLLQKLSEGEIDERILHWCVCLVRKVDTIPRALLGSLGRLQQLQKLVQFNRACIGLSEIMMVNR